MSRRQGHGRDRARRGARAQDRGGVGVLEVLVGAAILALGLVSVLDLMRGNRGLLDQSQDMLLLQNRTIGSLEEAAALVASGALAELRDEEEVLELDEPEFKCTVRIRRVEGRPLLRLAAQGRTDTRAFELAWVVADPLASTAGPIQTLPPLPPDPEDSP